MTDNIELNIQGQNPLVTVLLVTYNQETYVADALDSLLFQDYDNLEIIISDDCSTDSTYSIIVDVLKGYTGNKKIVLHRNTHNLGVVGNFSKAFNLAVGDLLFLAAGDDVSMLDRCSKVVSKWLESDGMYDLIAADAYDMSVNGDILGIKKTDQLENWTADLWAYKRPFFFGASFMVTRRLFSLNVLDETLNNEDHCLLFRAIMLGSACRLRMPLIKHRRGGVSQQGSGLNRPVISRKQQILKGALNAVREVNQMISDSEKLFMGNSVETALNGRLRTNLYSSEILSEKFLVQKFMIFFRYSDIDMSKRLRFLKYALFK